MKLASRIFVLVGIAVTLGLAVWAGYVFYDLARAPLSVPRPHSYDAARQNILELQEHALSEAARGEKAFFISHVGCAAPAVWQDPRVVDNLKRMRDAGVDVKLVMGIAGAGGEVHATNWSQQFAQNLAERGLGPGTYAVRERELPCHSAVAGSERSPRAYIALPQKDDTYPTQYITTTDAGVCLEWKDYLVKAFDTAEHSG